MKKPEKAFVLFAYGCIVIGTTVVTLLTIRGALK